LVLVAIAAFGILIGRLAQLQIVEGDLHRAQARRNIVRERSLATTRGVIRDAFGRVLAANRPSYNVYITPAEVDLETTWPRVMKVVLLDEFERAAIEKRIVDMKALGARSVISSRIARRPRLAERKSWMSRTTGVKQVSRSSWS